MKKILLIVAIAMSISTLSFGQFLQGSLTGWPGLPCALSTPSTPLKIVSDGTNYYASTEYQGIYRIPVGGISGGGTWTVYNNGLPTGGAFNPPCNAIFYDVYDMAISGNYLYAVIGAAGLTSEKIYRCNLSTGVFADVTPSGGLASGASYAIGARGNYVFIAMLYSSATYDIRYSLNTTTTWSSLTLNPSATTPSWMTSFNFVSTSGRWDMNFCCTNGLFIRGISSTGDPTGYGQGINTSLADCPLIDFLYNGAGTFTWAYLSQNITTSPGHKAAQKIIRIASGTSTPSTVTETPANTSTLGNISALGSWQGNAHFGLAVQGGFTTTSPVHKGDASGNNFAASSCTSSSATTGVATMFSDANRLLCGFTQGGVWYATNVACKTDEETGIEELDNEHITISPIPAKTQLTVHYHNETGEMPTMILFDIEGRQQYAPINNTREGEAIIDVSGLSKGIYMLEYNGSAKLTKRVIID